MNKEEIIKLINDPLIKDKVTNATNILMDMYELGFNNGIKVLQSQLDIANKKLDRIKEYADDKREGFNEDIRDYLDDNLIGNEDKVNKLREFRSWFIDILSIIGGNDE